MGQAFTAVIQDARGAEVDRLVFTLRQSDYVILQLAASQHGVYVPAIVRDILETWCAGQRHQARHRAEAGR